MGLQEDLAKLSKFDRDRFQMEVAQYLDDQRRRVEREAYERMEHERRMLMQQMQAPPMMQAMGQRASFYQDLEPPTKPPAIDPKKLVALKNAEPRKVQKAAPDYVGTLKGWRAWEVAAEKDGLRLKALGQSHVWQPRQQIEAVCTSRGKHSAPAFNCQCGVWAFKELDGLCSALNKYSSVKVLGNVEMWGRVVETENGYRAEKAYPSELWLFDSELEELGLIYDVPVRTIG